MKKLVTVLLVGAMLSGCANKEIKVSNQTSIAQESSTWQSKKQRVSQIQRWEAKGKVAASHKGEGGSASYVWEQDRDFYKIKMFGPFGSGSAELTGSSRQAIFEEGDGSRYVAKNPEQILHEATGLYIPVLGLMYWIKGVPSPNVSTGKININADGQLTYLEQSGWQINYQKYVLEKGRWLPSRMELKRDGMLVKLIVKSWEWSA